MDTIRSKLEQMIIGISLRLEMKKTPLLKSIEQEMSGMIMESVKEVQ